MAIAAPYNDMFEGRSAGAVYIFEQDVGGVWTQTAKIIASDPDYFELFGTSISLVGDRLAIGAPNADNAVGLTTGAAYVFEKNQQGIWTQTAKITASDGGFEHKFGTSVSLVGDRLVVGAPNVVDNTTGLATGAAYVFERDSTGIWKQAKIVAPDNGDNARFGSFVSLGDDIVAIAAPLDGTSFVFGSCSVYIYELDATGKWTQIAKITASDGAKDDLFGSSISLVGNRLLVGAPLDDTAAGIDTGSAYVFERNSAGIWKQAKIVASNAGADDRFGSTVAIMKKTVVVGAPFDDLHNERPVLGGVNTGSAHVFSQ
jgi:hypothetical protein